MREYDMFVHRILAAAVALILITACGRVDAAATQLKDIYTGNAGANSSPQNLVNVANNLVYFTATDGTNGFELYKSDGTSGGTTLVKDINPGPGSSSPAGFIPIGGGIVLFSATDGVNGFE